MNIVAVIICLFSKWNQLISLWKPWFEKSNYGTKIFGASRCSKERKKTAMLIDFYMQHTTTCTTKGTSEKKTITNNHNFIKLIKRIIFCCGLLLKQLLPSFKISLFFVWIRLVFSHSLFIKESNELRTFSAR